MKEKSKRVRLPGRPAGSGEEKELQGYPAYPASEDIYSKYREEKDINPEDISQNKELVKGGRSSQKDSMDDTTGDDLDVPGAELDDAEEKVGSEDEENNYYSIGGDDHDDLDENKG